MKRRALLSSTLISTPWDRSPLRRILDQRLLIARVLDVTNRAGLDQ